MPAPLHNDPDRVHILMCTRNGARWIRSQLQSLLDQTHANWCLWVSDDHSTDATREILAEFAAQEPGRVAGVFDGPGKGSSANFLSLICRSDLPAGYVALCDQDDFWLPHKLDHALASLRPMQGRPAAWSGRFWITDGDLAPRHLPAPWPKGPSLENAVVQNIMSGHTLTLNPEALALIRRAGPVAVPHHDWWIYLVLMACDAAAIADSEVVLHYRQHARNAVGTRSGPRALANRLAAVMTGELRDWISANLEALENADLPLSAKARHLLVQRKNSHGSGMMKLFTDFSVHRQDRAETAALKLATRLRRL